MSDALICRVCGRTTDDPACLCPPPWCGTCGALDSDSCTCGGYAGPRLYRPPAARIARYGELLRRALPYLEYGAGALADEVAAALREGSR